MFSKSRGRSEVNPVRVPRPKATQVRAQLGVQEQHALKMTLRSHTESVLDVLYMSRTRISYSFQWIWFQDQICSESTGIIERS
jgi:hypothetical protein